MNVLHTLSLGRCPSILATITVAALLSTTSGSSLQLTAGKSASLFHYSFSNSAQVKVTTDVISFVFCIILALTVKLPSWVTTTSGCMRAPSSLCQWMPFTGIRAMTIPPWTMTSCWWSWLTKLNLMTMWSPSPCPKAVPMPVTCAPCLDGATSTLMTVSFF